jgi:hypothetical protein
VQSGPVPGQDQADAWVREHTGGLIDSLPVRLDPATWLVLVTELATKVTWLEPFDVTGAAALGTGSPWAARLQQVLATPRRDEGGHRQFIASTPEAGDVIVHLGRASGLTVASVAAAADVPAARVLAAAQRIAPAEVTGDPVTRTPLAGLPLGDAPLWQIRELPGPGRDVCTAVLPAWSARTRLDLSDPSLGFPAAAAALTGGGPWEAAQAAMARYGREGFEAAAVTTFARAAAAFRPPAGSHRVADLRFAHPYAVVAVATDDDAGAAGPWHGLPVFSAWVAEPEEPAGAP